MKRQLKFVLLTVLMATGHNTVWANELDIRISGDSGQQESVETIDTNLELVPVPGATTGTQPVAIPTTFDPYRAQSGPLKLMNCRNNSQLIRVFNANDGVMWVPAMQTKVAKGKVSPELKCATSGKCKFDMGAGTTARVYDRNAGVIVYNAKGELKPTNADAVKRGCSVFK